jgi:hypothetical protein
MVSLPDSIGEGAIQGRKQDTGGHHKIVGHVTISLMNTKHVWNNSNFK